MRVGYAGRLCRLGPVLGPTEHCLGKAHGGGSPASRASRWLLAAAVVAVVVGLGVFAPGSSAAGPAASITVDVSPNSIVADGASATTATATVLDGSKAPLDGETTVTFSVDGGAALPATPLGGGSGQYKLIIPSTKALVTRSVTASDGALTSNTATFSQTVGPAATVSVSLDHGSIVADGGTSSVTATATVTDTPGHPLDGQTVTFSVDGGAALPATPLGGGSGQYKLIIPSTKALVTRSVTASDGALTSNTATFSQTVGAAANVSVKVAPGSIVADGLSTTTATATVTDTPGHTLDGHSVTFSVDGGGPIPASPVGGGKYQITITSTTTVGKRTVTATDTTAGIPSPPATFNQTPGPPTQLTLTLNPAVILADGHTTTAATATVEDAHGNPVAGNDNITFSSTDPGDKIVSQATPGDGTYTATIRGSTTSGSPTITATDNSTPLPAASAVLVQTANASTTGLTVVPGSVVTNQSVTMIATVTAITPATSPSGAVVFYAGTTPIGSCGIAGFVASGQLGVVICQAKFAAHTLPTRLTAAFKPKIGSNVAASASAPVSITVRRASSSSTLTTSAASLNVGGTVTYTSVVKPGVAGPTLPSGPVQFLDRGKPIAACAGAQLAAGGQDSIATCRVTYRKIGTHLVTVKYGGDGSFTGSASSAQQVTVSKPSVPVLGTIVATMAWGFRYAPSYTRVTALQLQDMPVGGTAHITCSRSGCPFAKRTVPVTKPRTTCRTTKKHRARLRAPGRWTWARSSAGTISARGIASASR